MNRICDRLNQLKHFQGKLWVSDWEKMLPLVKPLVNFVISIKNDVLEHFRYFTEYLNKKYVNYVNYKYLIKLYLK